MSNMSWLPCDVRWTWLNNQMAKPDIGAIGPFGRRNKYIKHRTTAIGQLTAALPTTRRCQVCVRLSLAKEGNFAHCPLFSRAPRHRDLAWSVGSRSWHNPGKRGQHLW